MCFFLHIDNNYILVLYKFCYNKSKTKSILRKGRFVPQVVITLFKDFFTATTTALTTKIEMQ